jgi:PAS domain S-box-containing protein
MNRPAVAQSVSRRSPAASADARVAFIEALLRCEDGADCAQVAVEYLVRQTRAREVLFALRVPQGDSSQLVGITGYGLEPSRISSVSVDVEDVTDPLALALVAREPSPVALPEAARASEEDRIQVRHLAIPVPLRDPTGALPDALLVVGPPTEVTPEVDWFVDVLGRALRRVLELGRLRDTEKRLARERALLETVLSAVPDPVLLTDPEGRLMLANPRAEALLASQEQESEGRRRAVALNNMLFSASLSRRMIEGAEETRRELPLVDPSDGSDRLFELLSLIIQTPEGPGIVSVLRNVTDLQLAMLQVEENYRKLRVAEGAVRAERDRLDLIIDAAADPIVVSDANGAITLMNPPAERLFTARESASADELQHVRANDAHLSSHVANVFLAPGSRFRGELTLVEPASGHSVPVEAISGTIVSEHGELTAVVTVLHDRTEALEKALLYEQLERASKELEQKVHDATAELVRQNELLRRQQIELEQASNLKSQFLANMSHEFRTPLNAILGYTSMLLQGVNGELTPPQRRSLERVDSNAHHLLTIINDILDISRIEAGRMPVHLSRFDLPELVAEVLAEVDPLIVRSKLEVRREIPGRLPKLRSDRPKVKQILVNLLSNALKFTPRGSVTVSAADDKAGRHVHVSVTDTGIGIADRDRERIFGDFQQVDNSPTRQYGGAGLGLSICRRLAQVLGGRLSLVSKVGQGSTFTLALPTGPSRAHREANAGARPTKSRDK